VANLVKLNGISVITTFDGKIAYIVPASGEISIAVSNDSVFNQ
jgi:hypothetical protein